MPQVGVTEGLFATFMVCMFVCIGLTIGIAYNYGKTSIDNQPHANNALYITAIIFTFLTLIFSAATGWAITNPT